MIFQRETDAPTQFNPVFSQHIHAFENYEHSTERILNRCSLLLKLLLLLCGDVEINHGPYDLISCVSASFSQSNEKFQPTNGSQCTCITLYGICFSVFKSVPNWRKYDLD